MECFFCSRPNSLLREAHRPTVAFCNASCQKLHYSLVAAGGQKRRLEEPSQEIQLKLLPFETQRKIMLRINDFDALLSLSQTEREIREYIQSYQFQRKYVKRHPQVVESFFTRRFTNIDPALESWAVVALEQGIQPDTLVYCIAKFNWKLAARFVPLPLEAKLYMETLEYIVVPRDHVEILTLWFNPGMDESNQFFFRAAIKAQASQCMRFLLQYDTIDYGDEGILSEFEQLPESAVPFLEEFIEKRTFGAIRIEQLGQIYTLRVKRRLFKWLNIQQIDISRWDLIVRQILYYPYSESLIRMVDHLLSFYTNGYNMIKLWNRHGGVKVDPIVFGVWLYRLRTVWNADVWVAAIIHMTAFGMDRNLISTLINAENAPTDWIGDMEGFYDLSSDDLQFLLTHPRIAAFFGPAQLY